MIFFRFNSNFLHLQAAKYSKWYVTTQFSEIHYYYSPRIKYSTEVKLEFQMYRVANSYDNINAC